MTIELDDKTLNLLAQKTAKILAKMLRNDGATDRRLIPCVEAAKRLGITPDRLRRIKGNFTHIKRGTGKQAKLFFDADLLIQEFNFLSHKS
jgi:hypothetical protein